VLPETTANQDRFALELSGFEENKRVSICEVLDRVLNKGVVVAGEITISVAGVDLLYLGLQLVLTSIETARASLLNGQPAGGLSIDIGKRRSLAAG
jgi:DNA-binding PucR family transcriptional regulator